MVGAGGVVLGGGAVVGGGRRLRWYQRRCKESRESIREQMWED